MEQGSSLCSGSEICLSVHTGAAPAVAPVPPLLLLEPPRPADEGPPAKLTSPLPLPLAPATVVPVPELAVLMPAEPTVGWPAVLLNDMPLAPPAAGTSELTHELSCKTKIAPMKARLSAWRGFGTSI
jgi:hypothetical protein